MVFLFLMKMNPMDLKTRPLPWTYESEHYEPTIIETKLPPPIFIRVVNYYRSFCANIREVTIGEHFCYKRSVNGVKLSTETVKSYCSVIRFLHENKADFHTYQLKQDKS